ncbi:MAG: hypothetical protein HY650_16465 [Acidobacteria bacterium]|nr:hypothetical protein [Acidobacteriota bacterium]
MSEKPSNEMKDLFGCQDCGVRSLIGDLDGEAVLALVLKLPADAHVSALNEEAFEARWAWRSIDRDGEVGLALEFRMALEGDGWMTDELIFLVGRSASMDQLRCLMRQSCLPAGLLDNHLAEIWRAGFEWTAEDRSEIASLTGEALARAYGMTKRDPGTLVAKRSRC